MPLSVEGPHNGQPVLEAGAALEEALAAAILLHGRGASARGMLDIADEFSIPEVAYCAPQAALRSWYPQSFTAPIEENEPELSSALEVVGELIDRMSVAGIGPERTVVLGFSQGACLATEFAARTPRRYGGIVGFSGGLIGPDKNNFNYEGSLDGTPIFLGCSDRDPYIPLDRVHATADVLDEMEADVTTRIYEGMGHTVNEDELENARRLLQRCVDGAAT